MIEIGLKHTSELTVTDTVTAIQMGSGDMPVLATPAMMALMENAAMLAVADELPEGYTTVGGHIEYYCWRSYRILQGAEQGQSRECEANGSQHHHSPLYRQNHRRQAV